MLVAWILWLALTASAVVAGLVAYVLGMDPLWAATATYAAGSLLVVLSMGRLR